MNNDRLIRYNGMKALQKALGIVEAERFIAIIRQDSFNYTEWRSTLWENKTVDQILDLADKKTKPEK